MTRSRLISLPATIVLLATVAGESFQVAGPRLPPQVEKYVASAVELTSDERKQLVARQPVTKLLATDESKEVAVFGAIWIDAPIRRYVEAVNDIERLERGGGFKVTKKIGTPPRLEDFAALRLPEEDLNDLRGCRVGDCQVKLGEQALQRFRTEVDWKARDVRPAADALMQRLAFEYVNGYLQGGNDRLAVYRDRARPRSVAQEFRAMVDQMPLLTTHMPDMRRYLLEYPARTLPDATSFLYWQQTEFGLKPTIRISHLTIREGRDDTVVVSKMLYATHYFWTGLEVRALVPDPARGQGFWFITVNQCRSDGLSGFTGMFVRRRVKSEVRDGALAGLKRTRQLLEAPR